MIVGHGVASGADLAPPSALAAYGAVAALLLTVLVLRRWWREPSLDAAAEGRPLLRWPSALVGASWVAGSVSMAVVLVAAWDAPDEVAPNLAPVALYVLLWVVVPVAASLAGDVWRGLAPWAPMWWRGRRDRPWAGAAGLLAFAWLALCYHAPSSPRVVGVAIVVWGLTAVSVGDPFAAWVRLVAAVAPLHRDERRRLRIRPPFAGLARVPGGAHVVGVVVVVLGSTAFDGLSRTEWWSDIERGRDGWEATAFASAGLLLAVAVVALLFRTAMELGSILTGDDVDELGAAFAPALVPIAFACVVAHYCGLVVFEAQSVIASVSDPFGRGWDAFGTAGRPIDYELVPAGVVTSTQIAAVLVGGIAATVVAHDRALQRHGPEVARSQVPFVALVAVYATGGLALLR